MPDSLEIKLYMNNKLNMLSVAMVLGFTNIAVGVEAPNVPSLFANGPIAMQMSATKMSGTEKSAYALFEATMLVAEDVIHATSCSAAAGKYTFNVLANGAVGDSNNNEITVVSPEKNTKTLVFRVNLNTQDEFRGQQLVVEQSGVGSLSGTEVSKFVGAISFNSEGTQMTLKSSVNIQSINGQADTFQGEMAQNFYLAPNPDDTHILSWGLQSNSKFDFPIERYWLRSKSRRDNGIVERTVLVKDRLAGASPCRILIDGSRPSPYNQNLFAQTGTLTISAETPNDPVPAFDLF
ncbi:MAG: hypothetical protein PHC94_09360 [Methylobacter sp.]|nr:hypothetical protein [Methylobacter sp.]